MSSAISGGAGTTAAMIANEYDTRVAKLTIDQQQQDGQSALALIESAKPEGQTASSPDGKGTLINTYA